MSVEWGIERKHPRYPFAENIHYCLDSALRETHHGVSVNISESGLCIYTFKPLAVGQDVVIKTSLKAPYVKAEVRWIKKFFGDFYRVGLMFTEDAGRAGRIVPGRDH